MYHTIEILANLLADVQVAHQKTLKRVRLVKGSRLHAQLKPYVVESVHGPVEVADVSFDDGSCIRAVPFACLTFVE
jgi:hypothetical protein